MPTYRQMQEFMKKNAPHTYAKYRASVSGVRVPDLTAKGASARAAEATTVAHGISPFSDGPRLKSSHLKAAQAHKLAADKHELAGNIVMARHHDVMAQAHAESASHVGNATKAPAAKQIVHGPRGGVYERSRTGKLHSIGHHNLQGHGGLKHR